MTSDATPSTMHADACLLQTFEYLPILGEQMYTMRHSPATQAAPAKRASVLIVGPIGAERERAYRTLHLLAVRMATAGFDTTQFDYRGIGESTGTFTQMTLSSWCDDVLAVANHVRSTSPGLPLILLGVRTGAILASKVFASGVGDAMLLIAPVKSGTDFLQEVMRRHLMAEMIGSESTPRRSRDDITRALDRGETVNVEGYPWTNALLQDASHHTLATPSPTERRPWHSLDVKLVLSAVATSPSHPNHTALATERFWEASPILVPRTTSLFDATVAATSRLLTKEQAA